MNSYGDPNSVRARAQVPGPASGAAGVGRASVGRATVSGAGGYSYDDAPAGGANGAHGAVNGASGRASVGRASVPGAAAGRASVRPVAPPDGPWVGGPGGPNGPGGPGGPGWSGGSGGPNGRGKGPSARAKRNKHRNIIIAALAVFIMLTGGVVVGGTWYYDDVKPPADLPVPEASTIFFADGTNQLAKLGEFNRTLVPISKVPVEVRHAVVAAEDRKFYEHNGVDIQGIARAAWNNVTGGGRQGASTITQQYARHIAQMTDITYARKLREAVIANKLEKDYSKDEILEHYLNVVYFGRDAYGIEAAAQTYFGVSVDKLTVEQAAVLAAVIRQPEPDANAKGFDPRHDEAAAKGRWDYVLNGMVEKKWLDQAKRDAMQYPKVAPYDPKTCRIGCGIDRPTGNVINYVKEEMKAMGLNLNDGGYQIKTSINHGMQTALERTIRRADPQSLLNKQPANLMAAAVAVDPKTGQVLAYYGGENGTGTDFAGYNWEGGKKTGGHPPGSSFKIYTLVAGLKDGISMDSLWDSTKLKDGAFTISNAGRTPACGKSCTLKESTIQSYNVPFYWMTKHLGTAKVIDAAKAAGIKHIWPDDGEEVDLTAVKPEEAAGKFHFQLGYGQYGVTVLDHANGVATLAARGVYRPAHFVVEVKEKDSKGQWKVTHKEQVKPEPRLNQNQVDDLAATLQNLNDDRLSGRPSARKTGTWELQGSTVDNSHAWMVGYTPQIATAVWVGNHGASNQAIREVIPGSKNTRPIFGSNLPGDIWKKFMDAAHTGMKVEGFQPAKGTGREDHPAANGASPSPKNEGGGDNKRCEQFPILCSQGPGDGQSPSPGGPGNGGGLLPSTEPTRRQ